MCIIERKTYIYPDGDRVVETARPCPRAVGSRLCKRIERRSIEAVRVVETSPPREDNPSDGVIVTEGRDGRQRIYRDLSKRSSNSSSVRRSNTMSDRSPVSTPSTASSPSNVDVKPAGPTLPPAGADTIPLERSRMPYPPAPSPPDPTRMVTPEGTAIYDRPPSLELPRAPANERPKTSNLDKKVSFSSTTPEVDDSIEPRSSKLPRRPTVSLDTNVRPSRSSSSPSIDSPVTSRLPKSALRRDSGKAVPNRDSRPKPGRRRTDSDRQDRATRDSKENNRRQQDEKESEQDRLVRIERERLADSDRRRRDASRERHREEAAAALEGQQKREKPEVDPVQLQRDAEFAQMARERAASDARNKRESDQARSSSDDRLRRDADARARLPSTRTSDRGSPTTQRLRRSVTSDGYQYPLSGPSPTLSARTPYSGTAGTQPVIHQYPSARRRDSHTIRERGEEVIAREQARSTTERLGTALGGLSVEDPYGEEYELVDDYYVSDGQQDRRRRHDRERRPQQFWR